MPTRLKSLELHGYKTFASQTGFVFAEAITAIVGPNGSGKSNIADSIRWVLGEQSFSLLRGKKTEDMIFSGSELRPRASMASVTLIFDNSDGWLPIDFAEVAVTRRAYRDGENEYLLNRQRVRLKDISEMLARSGLAERTYTVIGQGLVDAALALKAEERRRLFEEAAGIGLYRSRREESLRRLDTTRRNLERVQDILAELLPRLRSLERQAKRAQEYEQVRTDLQVLLREWYGYHWHLAQRELTETHDITRQREIALENELSNHATVDEQLITLRERLSSLRARLNSWHHQTSLLHNRRETTSRDLAVADERSRSLVAQQQNLQDEVVNLEEEAGLLSERLEEARREVDSLGIEQSEDQIQVETAYRALQSQQEERVKIENLVQEARQSLSELINRQGNLQARLTERQAQAQQQTEILQNAEQEIETAGSGLHIAENKLVDAEKVLRQAEISRQASEQTLQTHRRKIIEGESVRRKTIENHSTLQTELARLKAQSDVLEQAENAFTGYASGTRLLLKAASETRLKGVRGVLSNLLEVQAEYETAIAAALGEFMDAIILEDEGSVEDALQSLSSEIARAALLPLDILLPFPITLSIVPQEVVHASNLVQCAPEIRPALDLLLGNAWIVPDRSSARTLVRKIRANGQAGPDLRVITLRGEVFHTNGPIIAGQESKAGILERPRQRRELRVRLDALDAQLLKVEETVQQVDRALDQLRVDEDKFKEEDNLARESERAARLAYSQVELTVEKTRRQYEFVRDVRARLENEISSASQETQRIAQDLTDLEEPIRQARENLRQHSTNLAYLSLDELQMQLSHWNTRAAVIERAIVDVQNRYRELQVTYDGIIKEQQTARNKLIDLQEALDNLENEKIGLRETVGAVNAEISQLQLLIDPAEKELETLETQQEQAQTIEIKARQALSAHQPGSPARNFGCIASTN
jgi:chromosome segregation protein